jgi:hypothetical protein
MKQIKIASSPDRMTYQRDAFLKRHADKGLTPGNDQITQEIEQMYENMRIEHAMKYESTVPENDLEYDLRASGVFKNKVNSDSYAQRLYATLCNNNFFKGYMVEAWHCSWRHSGGIVADLRGEGDYIDWYLSGMRFDEDNSVELLTEGTICEEVQADLLTIGWRVEPYIEQSTDI